jgi:hypothetical protein
MLNLTPEENAFYDAVAANVANLFDEKTLCNLIAPSAAASSRVRAALRACGVRQAVRPYVADERRAEHDEDLYSDFEAFEKAMQKDETHLSQADLKAFLADDKHLRRNDPTTRLRSPPAQRASRRRSNFRCAAVRSPMVLKY